MTLLAPEEARRRREPLTATASLAEMLAALVAPGMRAAPAMTVEPTGMVRPPVNVLWPLKKTGMEPAIWTPWLPASGTLSWTKLPVPRELAVMVGVPDERARVRGPGLLTTQLPAG